MASALPPLSDAFFEDIIDGYFPLVVSLHDMMARRRLGAALLSITHAPIMDIPGLPVTAPVPLNIASGRAGIILGLTLHVAVTDHTLTLHGFGEWRWLDAGPVPETLDPNTRLAEPAFLSGIGVPRDMAADQPAPFDIREGGAEGLAGSPPPHRGYKRNLRIGPFPASPTIALARPTSGPYATLDCDAATARRFLPTSDIVEDT